MEFCEKCGSLIVIKEERAICANCSHKPKKRPKIEVAEKIEKKESVVVVKEGQDNLYPIIEITCTKCKHKKAYFWTSQTRAADEAETKFYKCTKCFHTWRVYK